MDDATIHPRMAERVVRNRRRRLKVDQATAIASLERAIEILRQLAQELNGDLATSLIQEYETALGHVRALDPSRLPSAASMLAIGERLENAARRMNEEIAG